MRVSSDNIQSLEPNQIFVFGSNLAGIHGAGAAKLAYDKFGAKWGHGFGLSGQSYAIPTKDEKIKTLPISEIEKYVDQFYFDASHNHKHLIFMITEIGCGLAGYSVEQVAPLFKDFLTLENVYLPKSFIL